MRIVAIVASALILATSLIAPSGPPLRAAEFGTRDEAIAMVRRVQEKFRKEGPEATFRAINSGAPGFIDRDLFPYVHKLDGTQLVATGAGAPMRGLNLHDARDLDGKFFIQEFVRIATAPPYHGWVDYRLVNPKTGAVEDASAWIERMGDYLVGVGVDKYEQPSDNTVGIISGSPNSDDTCLQMAFDLAGILNDGDSLRILPIVGMGEMRNIRDVRNLKGADIALTQTNILNSLRRPNEGMGQSDDKIVYIAKLFNEEVHLVARAGITSIEQLRGLKVNLDASSYSMRDLFKTLGIDVEEVSMSPIEALAKVKSGEIAATALIAGKPVRSMSQLAGSDGLHFVPIPYPGGLIGNYLPATLTHDDYPDLIAAGEAVDTVAVGAVLVTYNWPKSADQYRRVQRFVEAFFPKIAEFQKAPRHAKWREVNIAATLPLWTRFSAAQEWLDSHRQDPARNGPGGNGPATADTAGARPPAGTAGGTQSASTADQSRPPVDPALYQEFMRWRQLRP